MEEMKMKKYIKPEIEIKNITADDIIMTSVLPTTINGNDADDYGSKAYTDLFAE